MFFLFPLLPHSTYPPCPSIPNSDPKRKITNASRLLPLTSSNPLCPAISARLPVPFSSLPLPLYTPLTPYAVPRTTNIIPTPTTPTSPPTINPYTHQSNQPDPTTVVHSPNTGSTPTSITSTLKPHTFTPQSQPSLHADLTGSLVPILVLVQPTSLRNPPLHLLL